MINCCTPRHAHQSVAVKLKDTRCGVEEVSGCVAEVCMFVCCCLGDVHVSESMCIVAPTLLTYPSTRPSVIVIVACLHDVGKTPQKGPKATNQRNQEQQQVATGKRK